MKQYRILKRIVVCVIAFSLILTNAYYVNAKSGVNSRRFLAENDLVDNTNLSISSVASLTIGGEEYTEGMEIDEGDSFSGSLSRVGVNPIIAGVHFVHLFYLPVNKIRFLKLSKLRYP